LIRHHLVKNSGNEQDAEDLLQDAIVVLYKQCQVEPFLLQCSLKTYFIGICKNLWMQRLDYKFKLLYQADYSVHEPREKYYMEDQELQYEDLARQRLLYKHLMLLPIDCRHLLQLYLLKISYGEIAKLLKYKDEAYVKTRKYMCKNILRKKIMNDPESQQFLYYDEKSNHERLD
jgi:RNA polymerase sigma factor (sigma-70 family)